ncbi:MAG TPA: histidinol dehydrogenase, partial [Erysipelotrichaceae bacterium]|nr:histidinol dehydrogenase [Erysipelotrichaceae bacterium]
MLKRMTFKGNLKEIETKLHGRKTEISAEVNKSVLDIITNVANGGDKALLEYCAKFDGF